MTPLRCAMRWNPAQAMAEKAEKVTPELLLNAYAQGYFPMARSRKGRMLYWFNPETRSVLDVRAPRFSKSLKKTLEKDFKKFRITFDQAFEDIIRLCADHRTPTRDNTWINDEIIALYTELHRRGHAHSVECWQGEQLVGGVYGVSLGGVFCGESMVSLMPSVSKIALAALIHHLRQCGYALLDAQFENPHLLPFGFKPIPQANYIAQLQSALRISPNPSTRFSTTSPSSACTSGA